MENKDPTLFKGHNVDLLTASQGSEYISETKIDMPLSIDDETALLMNRLTNRLVEMPNELACYIILLQGIQDKSVEPIRAFDSTVELLQYKHTGVGGSYKYRVFEGSCPAAESQKTINLVTRRFIANERHSVHAPVDVPLYSKKGHAEFMGNSDAE